MPLTKVSILVWGQSWQVRVPVKVQMGTWTRFCGAEKEAETDSARRPCIVLAQIGEAPVMPLATRLMGALSLLPTQVATR